MVSKIEGANSILQTPAEGNILLDSITVIDYGGTPHLLGMLLDKSNSPCLTSFIF